MALHFKDADVQAFWEDPKRPPRRCPETVRRALFRKLQILDAATSLNDLRVPPGNRLEKLTGDRANQHSVRVNERWRPCFEWSEDGPKEVEFVDYH